MRTRIFAFIDLLLIASYSLMTGLWTAVCGISVAWALAVCVGALGFALLRNPRLRAITAVGVCSMVVVGLTRGQITPSAISIAVCGVVAVLLATSSSRMRRIVATNLVVLVCLLVVGEAAMRMTQSFDGAEYFQPIEMYRQSAEGGPDQETSVPAGFDGSLRRTTDQPAVATRRVLLFGGSTTACMEVADAQTWPSALQRALGGTASAWRVENHGKSAATAGNRAAALESISDLEPGDLVVFYVGVNDAGVSFTSRDLPVPILTEIPRLNTILRRLSPHSVIADQLFRVLVYGGISTSEEAKQAAVADFRAALTRAAAYSEKRGARFIPVLQSHLFTRVNPTDYDRGLEAIFSKRLSEVLNSIYPALWEAMRDFPGAIDARSAQDGLDRSPYYDWHHVDARGNEAIARFVYEQIDWNG